ncbi:rubredoxin [Rhodococcus hoagii]|nr:rubredoxin [Prescottella equi]
MLAAHGGRHERYRCPVCEFVFDEAVGAPVRGSRRRDVVGDGWTPDDWCCPDCGVREKIDFEPV